jgi:hypothetical protein
MVFLAPLLVFAIVIAFTLFVLRPRKGPAAPARMDPRGRRSVAGVDLAPDAALADAIRRALEEKGAKVTEIDHGFARDLDVAHVDEPYNVSIGWVGDEDAPWKVFVDGIGHADASERVLEAVHAVLVSIAGAGKVKWTSRERDAAGKPEWEPLPVDR